VRLGCALPCFPLCLSAFQVLCCVFAFANLPFHCFGFVAYLLSFITITLPDLLFVRLPLKLIPFSLEINTKKVA